jgi:mannosyltransferase OCH1-like enzyme
MQDNGDQPTGDQPDSDQETAVNEIDSLKETNNIEMVVEDIEIEVANEIVNKVSSNLNEEKYPDGIYTDKIEFSELLNQKDNAIIRQIKPPPNLLDILNKINGKNGTNLPSTIPTEPSPIPKKIFQTHKSIQFIKGTPKIRSAIDSWRKYAKEFEYYFYTDEVCDKFMQENFEGEIYEAYKKLPLPVMKADLWRYCIIYKYGGIYADADTICLTNPNNLLKNAQIVCAPESDHNYLCQWTFAAPPGSAALKSVIDLSVERIHKTTKFLEKDIVHFLTGPQVFTEGIEKYLLENSLKLFHTKTDYIKYSNRTPHIFVFEKHMFHLRMIKHLFAGFDANGWKRQRDIMIAHNVRNVIQSFQKSLGR